MSKAGCCPSVPSEDEEKLCSNRFGVMDELNLHYSERVDLFEKSGCTEKFEKYKRELCEKTELIKELNSKLKEQCDTLNQKECVIKRLKEEIDQLKKSVDNFKNKNNACPTKNSSTSDVQCQLEKLKNQLKEKEEKIKSLEEDLCACRQKLDSIKDSPETVTEGDLERRQVKDLLNKISSLEIDINNKDVKLQEYLTKIEQLQAQLCQNSQQLETRRLNGIPYIEEDDKQLEYENVIQDKLKEKQKEIDDLQVLINNMKASGDSNVAILKRNMENLKRESRDMKEALTAEVAEKHDMITILRRDTAQLEEKARQADMQAIFKDDIIKELRKEVKLARAKESFVEMLGLNEGSRVQMKAKIDSLTAELDEKQSEIASLENKLDEMNRHTLEGKLGEISLQLMDRERDMIILCNKVDYIKRYLEKLHGDEDISIKCGLKALLLELNEETEWRRKARRSVTSLGDQPESIIIINRSNSLPAEPSEHMRYNGRVNELECKLQRAKEEISCLKKKLDAKDNEIINLKESFYQAENEKACSKVLVPEYLLSLKLEEFQRFTEESGKKLHDSLAGIIRHAKNVSLKEEMEEYKCFLNKEQETFLKAGKQLHAILCNIKNTNPGIGSSSNYKLQCLEKKLKNAYNILEAEKPSETSPCNDKSTKNCLVENMMNKIQECMELVCELTKEAPSADSTDPMSSANSIKMIQEVQEMIKLIQNQSKQQQSHLFASLDNQKEDVGELEKRFAEADCLLRAHCTSINYVKDEFKIALCNINQKADKVKKQAESIASFECSVKDIANWANLNLKNNAEVMNKLCNLQSNLKEIMDMKNTLEDCRKDQGKQCKSSCSKALVQRQTHSTPELCQNPTEMCEPELSEFEDKCLLARDICDEVNKELDKATCRIHERESKDGCSDESHDYQEAAMHLQEYIKKLLQALCNIRHKLISHQRESDCYDIKGIESRKNISSKLNEMEEAFDDLSSVLGEMKECDYIKSRRALTSDSQIEIREITDESSCMENTCTQMVPQDNVIEKLRAEICLLNNSISSLEKQNSCHLKTIETLKCSLNQAKEEADKKMQMMVSNLQEKCQPQETIVSKPETSQCTRSPWVSWIYRQKPSPNQIHEV